MSKINKFKWLLENFEQCVADNCMDKSEQDWENLKSYKKQLIIMFSEVLNESVQ